MPAVPVVLALRTRPAHRQGVQRHRALPPGQHHQRVDVELRQLVPEFQRHALHPHDDLDERVQVGRGAPPDPVQEGPPAQLGQHVPRLYLTEGRHAYGGVLEHLHEHTAEPDRHRRAEQLVVCDTDDHLDAPFHHLAHEYAVQVHALVAGDVGQLAVGVADLAGRGQPDLHQAEFRLVRDLAARRLHHHRVAHQPRRPDGRRRAGHQLLARHPDSVRPQQQLGGVLAQCLARPHQRPRLAETGRRGARCLVERGAVGGGEPGVVEVGADGGHTVREGTEGGHAGGAEQRLAVRRLRADRRSPDHAHQLVRLLGRVHEVLREFVAHRGEGPGDRTDQDTHRRVGEDRVDDLPAAPVADRMPAAVHRVGHVQVVGYPLVQLGLPGGGQPRQVQPGLGRQVREVRPRAARDRIDGDPVGERTTGPGQQG